MTKSSPLNNLCGQGKPLDREAPNVDERIVADLIDACQSVADAIFALPPLSTHGDL